MRSFSKEKKVILRTRIRMNCSFYNVLPHVLSITTLLRDASLYLFNYQRFDT